MSKELKELNKVAIGRRIRTVREARNLTREQLAEKIDVSPQFIADVEYGNKGVSIRTLFQLSQVLKVSAEYLLSGQLYDVDENEAAMKTCEEIKDVLGTMDIDALKGFREISRVYVDMTQGVMKKKG